MACARTAAGASVTWPAHRHDPPAVARFESGGTTPTLPILERIANAFYSNLSVELKPKTVA